MREVQEGNLNHSIPIKTTLPEIISLHKSYNAMIEQMRIMLSELKETTTELETTGEDLKTSSADALTYSRQLIEAINIVKKGAEETASSSESSAYSFRAMKQKVEEMTNNMELVNKSSGDMNNSAQCGEENISQLINTIDSFEKDFVHMTKTIQLVKNHSSSIAKLVVLIQGIAEQTKQKLQDLQLTLPELEQATNSFTSVSQETLASAEEMLSTSDEQISQMETTHQIGLKLTDTSKSLTNITKNFKL